MKNRILFIPVLALALAAVFGALALGLTGCENPAGTDKATVSGVRPSPSAVTITRGGSRNFTAEVVGANSPEQTVTWTVEGNNSILTRNTGGVLLVAEDETAETLFFIATSTVDPSQKGSATVTVVPKAARYSVSFDSQGGSAVAGQSVASGGKAAAPSPAPAKDGYTLEGWYTEAACTTRWDFASNTVSGNITLYAKWTQAAGSFAVSFDSLGGSAAASQSVASGGKAAAPSPVPTKDGYTLEGWYTEAACTTRWDFASNTVSGNITLYAKWTQVAAGSFAVSFDSQGGSAVAGQSVASGGKAAAPNPVPAKDSYTFEGWYTEAACTTRWDFASNTVSGNITLYAKWTQNQIGSPPGAVTLAPVVLPAGFGRLSVIWQAASGADSYEVWAGVSAASMDKKLDDAQPGVTLTGLTAATNYYIKVRAKNDAGKSGYSPVSQAVRTIDALPEGFLAAQDHWGSGVGDGYKIDADGYLEYLGVEGYVGNYSFTGDIRYHKVFPAETVSSRNGEQIGGASGVFILEYREPLPNPGGAALPGRFQGIYYWGLGTNHVGEIFPGADAAGKPQVFMANSANLAALDIDTGEDGSTGVNPETQTLQEAIDKFTLAKRDKWVSYGVVYPQILDFAILKE